MKTINYIIKDKEGIHARPAGALVATAKKYTSKITMINKGKEVDAKRIFGVMGLCVKSGEEVVINIEGDDEEAAYNEIKECLESNL